MTTTISRQAIARIDLNCLAHNFRYVKTLAPDSQVMAVIKADAYGHGAAQVASALTAVDAVGVSRMSEAITLRKANITKPICLLEGVLDTQEVSLAAECSFDLVVHAEHQLSLLKSAAAPLGVWIKIDTGMNRLGFQPDRLPGLLAQLAHHKILGVMTHLARADEDDTSATLAQMAIVQAFAGSPVMSVANSAGIIRYPECRLQWVRPGIMLYGASPFPDLAPLPQLKPVMTFSAPIIAIRELSAGESVGYGAIWVADKNCRIAVVAAGYGDGYPREVANTTSALVQGKRRAVVGRVSMDMLTVQLNAEDVVNCGEHVVLWGPGMPVEEVAECAGTVPYTLLSGLASRVQRQYEALVD